MSAAQHFDVLPSDDRKKAAAAATTPQGDFIPIAKRETSTHLSKYERAKLLLVRSQQISHGLPVLVDIGSLTNPIDIAMKELEKRKIPLVVRRYFPDLTYEDWRLDEFESGFQ